MKTFHYERLGWESLADTFDGASVLITGSRDWPAGVAEQIADRFRRQNIAFYRLHHGDAEGADRMAAAAFTAAGIVQADMVQAFPYPKHLGRAGGPIRNSEMVKLIAHMRYPAVLALWDGHSSGTADCMKKACRANLPLCWITPELDLYRVRYE